MLIKYGSLLIDVEKGFVYMVFGLGTNGSIGQITVALSHSLRKHERMRFYLVSIFKFQKRIQSPLKLLKRNFLQKQFKEKVRNFQKLQ